MAELKPCPFWGGEEIKFHNAYGSFMNWYSCTECGCEGPDGDSKEEAIEAWNRREGDGNG